MAGGKSIAVILAAGEGTRMKSALPKVLHPVCGRSMLGHVLALVADAGIEDVAVVIGPQRDDVAAEIARLAPHAQIFIQTERLGTAHAVLAARDAFGTDHDDVLVLFADTPLVAAESVSALRARVSGGAAVAALGFEAKDPSGYGRLLTDGESLIAIREHKDASEAERAVRLCNSGLMAVAGREALSLLDAVRSDNAQKEFYLTDIVGIARSKGLKTVFEVAPESDVQGVNDRSQLSEVEATLQQRLRRKAMMAGVTMIDPASVYLSFDTVLGRDVVIEPNVFFGPGVVVEDGVTIHAFSHLEETRIEKDASIGPFARIRPGSVVGAHSKIGNFVELKKAILGQGVKVSHLSYIGDAELGADTNIGAGTITCNYDGFFKYKTVIGEGAFIGANSSLVAPVTIGAGAFVGSGSVITKDVAPDSLAVARGKQMSKEGWGQSFRAQSLARKKGSSS